MACPQINANAYGLQLQITVFFSPRVIEAVSIEALLFNQIF